MFFSSHAIFASPGSYVFYVFLHSTTNHHGTNISVSTRVQSSEDLSGEH